MNHFRVANLDQDELLLAWPLVRASEPMLELEGWRLRGEMLIECGGGVLAARSADGTIHGVATYEVVERLVFGSILHVATIVTFELTRHDYARQALTAYLHRVCRSLGCAATVISEMNRPVLRIKPGSTRN